MCYSFDPCCFPVLVNSAPSMVHRPDWFCSACDVCDWKVLLCGGDEDKHKHSSSDGWLKHLSLWGRCSIKTCPSQALLFCGVWAITPFQPFSFSFPFFLVKFSFISFLSSIKTCSTYQAKKRKKCIWVMISIPKTLKCFRFNKSRSKLFNYTCNIF